MVKKKNESDRERRINNMKKKMKTERKLRKNKQ